MIGPSVYPPHHLFVFGGTLGLLGSETWSCGLRCGYVGGGSPAFDEEAWLTAMAPVTSAWFSDALSLNDDTTDLQFLKCNRIGADGKYAEPESHTYFYPTPIAGVSPISTNAFQVSLVMTHLTSVSRGPACRGRIYLPRPGVGVLDTGLFTGSQVDGIRNRYGEFLEAIRIVSAGGVELIPSVVSRLPEPSGTIRTITGLRTDTKPDTQRRRAQQLVGTFAETVVPD